MRKILILLLISGLFLACDLDTTPISSISVDSFWKTEDDAIAGMEGMYSRFRAITNSDYYAWGAGRSDEIGYGYEAATGFSFLFENLLSDVNSGPDWRVLYSVVNDANSVISFVPDISFKSDAQKNNTLAQAYAMRAFTYFILARVWGDVPISTEPVDKFSPSSSDSYKIREDVGKVFTLIKEDIDKALELFGDDDTYPAGRAYWSKPAVNALKGDVYLWTGKLMDGGDADIEIALQALQDIQETDVQLLPVYDNVFRQKGNREVLFAINYALNEAGDNFADMMYIRNEDIPLDAETVGKRLVGTGGGHSRWAPSQALRSEFTNDDLRKNITFAELWVTRNGVRQLHTAVALKYKGFSTEISEDF